MDSLGARVYGLGAILMGIAGIVWADFAAGWMTVPAALPGRAVLAYLVAALLLAGGIAIELPRWSRLGIALVTAVLGGGLVLIDLPQLIPHLLEFGYWESSAEQFAMVSAGLIALAAQTNDARWNAIVRVCLIVFALSLMIFGAAHFVYAKFSATFVPVWLPPSQMAWVYITGAAAIAAGLAIASGVLDLLAARLLTLMYVIFQLLAHVPRVAELPSDHFRVTEFIVNIALIGAAWIVADHLAARRKT